MKRSVSIHKPTKPAKPKAAKKNGAKALKNNVAQEYIKKGLSPAKAKAIGGAVVRKVGVKKYGAKKFNAMAKAGRKRA